MWPVVGPSDTQLTQLHLLISRPSVAVPKTWWPAASCPLPLISLPSLDTALTQQPATALFQLTTKQTAPPRQLWSQRMQLGGNVVIWLLFENVDGAVTIKTYQPHIIFQSNDYRGRPGSSRATVVGGRIWVFLVPPRSQLFNPWLQGPGLLLLHGGIPLVMLKTVTHMSSFYHQWLKLAIMNLIHVIMNL